jgi:hypothetical protein
MIRFLIPLALLTSCASQPAPVLQLGPGAYRVTFPDGSGSKSQAWACARTAPTELECIDVDTFIRIVEQAKRDAQRPLSQEL